MFATEAEVFLYGAYVVIGLYMSVLRSRGGAKNRGLTVATILLFIFCTAHYLQGLFFSCDCNKCGVYYEQILRCYGIWNFQLKIIIFPILLTLAVAAGRVWWIGRTLLGRTVISKYHTVCAMIKLGVGCHLLPIAFATIGFTLDQVYWTTGAILGQLVVSIMNSKLNVDGHERLDVVEYREGMSSP
ncbi:hypothetical protein B0H13DRAFT_1859675 [Mycena leptocephala]|nr:hypothetical protein B0H13DRAFT_1859675 [Mycena leptocephala]